MGPNVVPFLQYRIQGDIAAMTIASLSGAELNRDVARAKKAMSKGPVIITDRGKPSYVLLGFEDYQRLTQQKSKTVGSLSMPEIADIEFEPPRLSLVAEPADLS